MRKQPQGSSFPAALWLYFAAEGKLASHWWGRVVYGLATHRVVLRRAPLKGSISITWEPVGIIESQAPSFLDLLNQNLQLKQISRWFMCTFRLRSTGSRDLPDIAFFQQQNSPSPVPKLYPFTFHFQSLNRLLCSAPGQTISVLDEFPTSGSCSDPHFYGSGGQTCI